MAQSRHRLARTRPPTAGPTNHIRSTWRQPRRNRASTRAGVIDRFQHVLNRLSGGFASFIGIAQSVEITRYEAKERSASW
jgi:hypothetical protein